MNEYTERDKLVSRIFIALSSKGVFVAEGYEVRRKSWLWFVNGKEVTATEAHNSVFEYAHNLC